MRQIKKLLAGLLTAALLVSLVPAAVATPAEEDLLKILDRLYAEQNGAITLLDADSVTSLEKKDEEHTAKITIGQVIAGTDGTVEVPVYVTASAGLSGVQMKVTPGAGLTYIGQENDGGFTVGEVQGDDALTLVFANAENVALTDGLLTTLSFTVDESVAPTTVIPVTVGTVDYVTYWETDGEDIYKVIYSTVEKSNGSVTVPTTATITLGSDGLTASAGETVTVPISIQTNYESGVNGIQMTILYDKDVLSIDAENADSVASLLGDDISVNLTNEVAHFVGDADTAKVKSIVNTDAGELSLSLLWANDANIKLDGQIAELVFTVAGDLGDKTEATITGEVAYVTYEASAEDTRHQYDNISLQDCTIALSAAPAYLLGDVNEDGVVDSTDATLILQYDAKSVGADDFALNAGDVNGDGAVDSTDATLILQLDAKKITGFGSGTE